MKPEKCDAKIIIVSIGIIITRIRSTPPSVTIPQAGTPTTESQVRVARLQPEPQATGGQKPTSGWRYWQCPSQVLTSDTRVK
jgi:hypothetical protein